MITALISVLAFSLGALLAVRGAGLAGRLIEADARFTLFDARLTETRNAMLLERVRHENEVRGLREAFRLLGARNPFHTPAERDRAAVEVLARVRMAERALYN